jgi:hypothetical protein
MCVCVCIAPKKERESGCIVPEKKKRALTNGRERLLGGVRSQTPQLPPTALVGLAEANPRMTLGNKAAGGGLLRPLIKRFQHKLVDLVVSCAYQAQEGSSFRHLHTHTHTHTHTHQEVYSLSPGPHPLRPIAFSCLGRRC